MLLDSLARYLDEGLSHPVPPYANPADHALDVISTDFIRNPEQREALARELAERWCSYSRVYGSGSSSTLVLKPEGYLPVNLSYSGRVRPDVWKDLRCGARQALILMERNALNYSRNLLAYGIRLAMYCKYCKFRLHVHGPDYYL